MCYTREISLSRLRWSRGGGPRVPCPPVHAELLLLFMAKPPAGFELILLLFKAEGFLFQVPY